MITASVLEVTTGVASDCLQDQKVGTIVPSPVGGLDNIEHNFKSPRQGYTVLVRLLLSNPPPFPRRMFLAILRSARAIYRHKQCLCTPVVRSTLSSGVVRFSRPRVLPRPIAIRVIKSPDSFESAITQSFLSSVAGMSEKKLFERLPTDVVPRNYAVELQPDLKKFVFTGKLAITVEVGATDNYA